MENLRHSHAAVDAMLCTGGFLSHYSPWSTPYGAIAAGENGRLQVASASHASCRRGKDEFVVVQRRMQVSEENGFTTGSC